MASANFGFLANFDHEMQNWNTYKCRITQWFIANEIIPGKDPLGVKRRAILLSALSEKTYKLAADLALPKELQDVPYEDIVSLLDVHFTPKHVGFSERHKFYAATQQPTESPSQWAARLRGLTAQCQFSNVEEALLDRFIMGMQPGGEKEKLYVQDLSQLTLAKAVDLAESLRSARAIAVGAAAVPPPPPSSAPDQLYKIAKVKCSVCGYTNHKSESCRFASYTCKKCNVKGHLRRMCKKVNFVVSTASEVNEGDDDDGKKLFNIRSVRGEPLIETVTVNGKNLQFEIDSGSAVTIISEETFRAYFNSVPLNNTNKKLVGYSGEVLRCVGCARMSARWGGRERALDVFVVRGGGPSLLGRDFMAQFALQLSPIHHCDDLVQTLRSRYPNLFLGNLGCFNKFEAKLILKEGSKPVFFKARPVAFALKDKVGKEIDRLVDLGVLRPVEHSEYASPIVPVLKRDGSVRICVDYSVSINKQLVVDQYPLPLVNELFAKLHGGCKFSKLDLSMAYNQLCLDSESQKLTCINTHRGLFAYTRLVFGLASAPAIFQRAMENLLAGIDGVLVLLDDVLVTGVDTAQHLDRLNKVLQRLQDAGLTLQRDKCDFFRDEISYLGYVINKNGLKKSPEKVKAILDAPVPKSVSQLQSFLGLVNYYRCFVPGASSILSPLYELLKKGCKWIWSRKEDEAFNKIKSILASEQVLAHFNPKAKLILTVDASPSGLGAILSQIEEDGHEKPISFASRTLNSAERRYSQIQKEATAIIFGVRRFHQYLYGRSIPFVLRTDHKPLLSIFGPHKGIPEISANRLQRYALFLSAYNYSIEYIKSTDNTADYLSRASVPESAEPCEQEKLADVANATPDAAVVDPQDRAAYVCFVVDGALPVTVAKLRDATSRDHVLVKVIQYVLNGWPKKVTDYKIKPYHLCRLELSHENGCLMRGHKVVIPESLRERIMAELHTSHYGIIKTKAEARARFWFPGIDAALERMIASCEVCVQLRASPPRAPMSPWCYPPHPFHRIHLDFLGPINGHMYLVIVDAYTKWVEVYEMGTSSTSAVIEKLCEFMSRFGLPRTLVTDNGTSFCSQDFNIFCNSNGISHVTSPPYHPASNGQAESYVKIVKRGIKCSLQSCTNMRESKLKLLRYLFDYRNSIHSTTGKSPAQLVFGRQLRARLDLLAPAAPSSPPSDDLAQHVRSKQCSQTDAHRGTDRTFFPGQRVLYKKYISNNKFSWAMGVIEKEIGKMLYLIKDSLSSLCVRKHKDQILLYKGSDNIRDTGHGAPHGLALDALLDTVATSHPAIPPSLSPTYRSGEDDGSLDPSAARQESPSNTDQEDGNVKAMIDRARESPSFTPRDSPVTTLREPDRRPSDLSHDVGISTEGTSQEPATQGRPKRVRIPVDYKPFF